MSSPPTPSIVHARGLGKHELRVGDRVITPTSDRLFTLGFHLSVRAGEHIPRDELATLFWDGDDPRRSRHSLRQMLYRLRQHGFPLEEDMLAVHLPERFVDCDVREALRPGWDLQAPADQVIAGGDPIAGGPRDYTTAYQEWYDALEARLRAQLRRAALRHLSLAKLEGRWAHVEDWALHVLRHDALNEEATLARAEAMAMSGSKSRALDVLDAYLAELGDRTAQIGLPARVLRKRIAAQATTPTDVAGKTELNQAERLLVGREADLARINSSFGWDHNHGYNAILLHGPAGIGKTRLLEEIAANARLAGFEVITLRFLDSEFSLSQNNVRAFLRDIISVPGSAGASPESINLLRSIVLEDEHPIPVGLALQSAVSDDALIAATAEVIAAACEECRLLLVCEDIHAAPASFSSAFLGALVQLASSRTKVLLSSRVNAASLQSRGTRLAGSDLQQHLVGPLSDDATRAMCASLLKRHASPYDQRNIEAIARASGGNPLFALSLAKQFVVAGAIRRVPENVGHIITTRIAQLQATDLSVLNTILLLGSHASIPQLRKHFSSDVLAETVAALEGEGILHLHDNTTLALHACWAELLNDQLRGARRAALAYELAARLVTDSDKDSSVDIAWHSARLFKAGGDRKRALTLLCGVCDSLSTRGLAREALEAITEAEATASSPVEMQSVGLRKALAYHSLGNIEEAYQASTHALTHRCDGSEESTSTRLLLLAEQTDAAWRLDIPFEALLARLVDVLEDRRINPEIRQRAAFVAIRIAFNDRTSGNIDRILEATRAAGETQRLSPFGALTYLVAAAERADVSQVSSLDETLESMDLTCLPVEVQCLALRYRSQALRWTGNFERANAIARRAYSVATSSSLLNETSILAVQIAFMNLDRESVEDAQHWLSVARGSGRSLGRERDAAIWHLQARLLIQSGDTANAFAFLRNWEGDIRNDKLLKRQCAAASMYGYSAALQGEQAIALEMLNISTKILGSETPSLQLDLPCELCFLTAVRLGMDEAATEIMSDYVGRRMTSFPITVAPCYRALSAATRSSFMPPT